MKLRRLLPMILVLALLAGIATVTANAVSDEPYVYQESVSTGSYSGEHYALRTPDDDPGALYVEGKTEISTAAFLISLKGQDGAFVRAFVYPDSSGEFAVRIDLSPGSKDFPTATRGRVVSDERGGQSNVKCYSTMPGYVAMKEMPAGFYRVTITRAFTQHQADGIFDRDCGYEWYDNSNPLSGNHGYACKEFVLYAENNVPHLLHYTDVAAHNDSVRSTDSPLEAGTAAFAQYTDPWLTDIEGAMGIDGKTHPLSEQQVAYLADVASEVTAGADGDYQKVLQIYRYVCRNFYYDHRAFDYQNHSYCNPYDNLYKLRTGADGPNCVGGKVATVCEGYAAMVIALCRAEGIPARMVNGAPIGNAVDAWNNTEKYSAYKTKTTHWWCEAYVDGRWIAIDAQVGSSADWRRTSWDVADDDCWQRADDISYRGFDMSEDALADTYYYHEIYASSLFHRDVPAPVIRSADTSIGYVAIEWDPVPGTEYYYLYRGTSPDSLRYLTYTKPDETRFLSLTDPEEPGVTYYYRVLSKQNGVEGTRSHLISVCVSEAEREAALRAPVFDQQPVNTAAEIGEYAVFSVEAHNGDLQYQWQYYDAESQFWSNLTSSAYEGIHEPTLRVPVTRSKDGRLFRCRVSNELFQSYSEPARLTALEVLPVITLDPADAAGVSGDTVTFTVAANGNNLEYKWQYYYEPDQKWYVATGSAFSGEETDTLTVTVKSWLDGTPFRCRVSNPSGSVLSAEAQLTLIPVVSTQPKTTSAWLGDTAVYTVRATGSNLSYQWQYRKGENSSWSNSSMEGCKTESLHVKATAARDGYQYRCKITNSAGTCISDAASLAVKQNITTQPVDRNVTAGNNTTFSVKAKGDALRYQWQYSANGGKTWSNSSLTGSKTDAMTVAATMHRSGYQYRCKVTNNGITTYSQPATLTVKNLITDQPWTTWAIPGETTGFSLYAGGSNTKYQWQYRTSENGTWYNSSFDGCNTRKMTFQALLKRDGYQYRCKVTNNGVTEYSKIVTLRLYQMITSNPKSASVAAGTKVQFSVATKAGTDLHFQWQFSSDGGKTWSNSSLTGSKTDTMTVSATAYRNGYLYRCKVTNHGVTVISSPAKLTVK